MRGGPCAGREREHRQVKIGHQAEEQHAQPLRLQRRTRREFGVRPSVFGVRHRVVPIRGPAGLGSSESGDDSLSIDFAAPLFASRPFLRRWRRYVAENSTLAVAFGAIVEFTRPGTGKILHEPRI